MTPRRVAFSRKKGRIYRGGLKDYTKLRKDVVNWLNQDTQAFVTTMVDLYAFADGFPRPNRGAKMADPCQRVAHLEEAFAQDVNCERFLPHIQLHEFEAMLFTDIAKLAFYYPAYSKPIQSLVTEVAPFKKKAELSTRAKLPPPPSASCTRSSL